MGLVFVFQVEIDQGRGIKIRFPQVAFTGFLKEVRNWIRPQRFSCNSKKKVAIQGDLLLSCLLIVTKTNFLASENHLQKKKIK